jgi:hypothetical protein
MVFWLQQNFNANKPNATDVFHFYSTAFSFSFPFLFFPSLLLSKIPNLTDAHKRFIITKCPRSMGLGEAQRKN